MVLGVIEGIRKSVLNRLENIYEHKIEKENLVSEEIINTICEISQDINKEISIAIDRKGNVINVAVGDSTTVEMPIIDIKERKLSGIRVIHTHPNGNSMLSALDVSALIKLKLDCMAAIGVKDGKCEEITLGFCGLKDNKLIAEVTKPISLEKTLQLDILKIINPIEMNIKEQEIYEDNGEKAILVGIEDEESLEELEELAEACNVSTVGKILQKRSKIDTTFFIGEGKVEELSMLRQAKNANVIIFDDELSPSQIRNVEELTGTKVIDRTTLILEIFARRAKSKEAKIQVELAQLKYRLPRLSGMGAILSRTGGGIGTRGPGEKKLEIDRRHIKERVHDLTRELEKIKKNREIQRDKRSRESIPRISLVGYTNAGKSTLRNKLCEIASPRDITQKENVFEADMLFATLDVTTRAIYLPDNRLVTLTDTVGFVRKLPHDLVEAFKSTLEEVINSDLLLHVIDSSSEKAIEQIQAVNEVLTELGAINKPTILLLNKIDKADMDKIKSIVDTFSNSNFIEISAKEGINLNSLLDSIANNLPNKLKQCEYLISYADTAAVALLHRASKVLKEEYKEDGINIIAMVEDEVYNKCEKYLLQKLD